MLLGRARSIGASGFYFVVNPGPHRLVQLNASCAQDREEGDPERLECRLRFPDVEDLDLAICLKRHVGDASIRGPRARLFELAERRVVLLLREPFSSDVETKCHSIPNPFARSARWVAQQCGRLYFMDPGRRSTKNGHRVSRSTSTAGWRSVRRCPSAHCSTCWLARPAGDHARQLR